MKLKGFEPIVVTVDSDLLVFSEDVVAVLVPTYSRRSFIMRSHVNEVLGLNF